jgi:hypothetical protein
MGHGANQFKIQNSKFKIKEFWAWGMGYGALGMRH